MRDEGVVKLLQQELGEKVKKENVKKMCEVVVRNVHGGKPTKMGGFCKMSSGLEVVQ